MSDDRMRPHAASIYLIHAPEDHSFAARLAHDLDANGVRVCLGQAGMGGGDGPPEAIAESLGAVDYVGPVISAHSPWSGWVTREAHVVRSGAAAGRRVEVLPLLLEGEESGPTLGATYGDFTAEAHYAAALHQVLIRLGVVRVPADELHRLEELAASHPFLGTLLLELRAQGISDATADAVIAAPVDDADLSEFLELVVKELGGRQLFGLALSLVHYVDRRAVGNQALDYCLHPGRLPEWQRQHVLLRLQGCSSTASVVRSHSKLTAVPRDDAVYYSFLQKHADVVLEQCYDEMASYLLEPDRGPGGLNVDSFAIVLSRADRIAPFERRWLEWIDDGYFDRPGKKGHEWPLVLYGVINDYWGHPRFESITHAIESRVHRLLTAEGDSAFRDALHHLVAMVDARYRGAGRVLTGMASPVQDLPNEQRVLLDRLTVALRAVADFHQRPDDKDLERLVHARFGDVFEADRVGITGYWQPH